MLARTLLTLLALLCVVGILPPRRERVASLPAEFCAAEGGLCPVPRKQVLASLGSPAWAKHPVMSVGRGRRASLYSPAPSAKLASIPPPAWLAQLKPIDFAIPLPERVEPHLRFFTASEGGRKMVSNWLRRSALWRREVGAGLRLRHLPQDMEALVFVESGYSPTAVSLKGATGLWQLMPRTASELGLQMDDDLDERRSVWRSTEAALTHLEGLYARFGTWDLAFAAYDLGARGVQRRMEQTGAMDYWSLSSIPGVMPRETAEYVPKILAFALVLRNLEHFDFQPSKLPVGIQMSPLEVPEGTSLKLVAKAAGTSVDVLHELNPEILGDTVPGPEFCVVHVPSQGIGRARVMLGLLIDGQGDGLETQVPNSFDWSKDTPPAPSPRGSSSTASHNTGHVLRDAAAARIPSRVVGVQSTPSAQRPSPKPISPSKLPS